MSTEDQFKTMCDIAMKERHAPLSAICSVAVTEMFLGVFGWSFGVSELRRLAKDVLVGWKQENETFRGMTKTVYRKDGFVVTLESM